MAFFGSIFIHTVNMLQVNLLKVRIWQFGRPNKKPIHYTFVLAFYLCYDFYKSNNRKTFFASCKKRYKANS